MSTILGLISSSLSILLKQSFSYILLIIIYIGFISLGLPDALLGSCWPIMHAELNVPLSYAGIITFVILIVKVMPYHKKNLMFFLNIMIIGIVIAHSLGRVGCFLAGCCYGKETTSILGVTFPKGSTAYFLYGPNHNVLPTQLFEAIFLFILFIILFFMKKNQFITYLFSYGIFRFILEFFRGDNRGYKVRSYFGREESDEVAQTTVTTKYAQTTDDVEDIEKRLEALKASYSQEIAQIQEQENAQSYTPQSNLQSLFANSKNVGG